MDPTVITYLVYLAISIALTIWVARTLHRNGRPFLVEVFHGDETISDSVNHLLVVGFYLINLGYVSLALKLSHPVTSTGEALEVLSTKIGTVLLVLGGMHFLDIYLLGQLHQRSRSRLAARVGDEGPRGAPPTGPLPPSMKTSAP